MRRRRRSPRAPAAATRSPPTCPTDDSYRFAIVFPSEILRLRDWGVETRTIDRAQTIRTCPEALQDTLDQRQIGDERKRDPRSRTVVADGHSEAARPSKTARSAETASLPDAVAVLLPLPSSAARKGRAARKATQSASSEQLFCVLTCPPPSALRRGSQVGRTRAQTYAHRHVGIFTALSIAANRRLETRDSRYESRTTKANRRSLDAACPRPRRAAPTHRTTLRARRARPLRCFDSLWAAGRTRPRATDPSEAFSPSS